MVGVADGDTLTVLHDRTPVKVRLFGIDAPEKGQAFGQRSKQFASEAAFSKTVTIVEHGMDKYGRTLGDVILPDGSNLNQELVRAGLAWWYRRYAPNDATMQELEQHARAEKAGLWVDKEPVPPWEWRKLNKVGMGRGEVG